MTIRYAFSELNIHYSNFYILLVRFFLAILIHLTPWAHQGLFQKDFGWAQKIQISDHFGPIAKKGDKIELSKSLLPAICQRYLPE